MITGRRGDMNDNVENLVLEMLRRMDQRLDNIENDLGDIKLRVTATEEHLASMMMSIAGINSRMDKLDNRMSRIEKRLDLTESR
jgi:predicted  nucleic acid-binding Zn-ribbon protein